MDNLNTNRIYHAAIYVRLSKEDSATESGTDKEESDSIVNQKELIRAFLAEKPDIEVCMECADDGYSGANFERPNFQRIIREIEASRIDCVVVKDLSRFGRNFVEAGRYIDQIFPALGVRFIAIIDGFDSVNGRTSSDRILIPFKNLINDAYCRDISIKVRSQLETKRKKGDFIGFFAVYGYLKDPADRHKLAVDDYAAGVVNDGYDTLSGDADGMVVSLKNHVNDLYAKDISRKINSTFETMRAKGQITSGNPPYGYLRSGADRHKLVMDPETAPAVRDIFRWRMEGDGMAQIARRLNDSGVMSPPMFHYLHGHRKDEPYGTSAIWKADHIRFMLQNYSYAGHTAQGRVKKSLSDGLPLQKTAREDWVIVRDTHEAVVDQETFDKVQELVEQRCREYQSIRGKYETTENILKGLLVCADCGQKMIRHKSVSPAGTARYVFQCRTYAENLGGQGCTIKNVGEPELKECIQQALQVQVKLAVELEGMLERLLKRLEFKGKQKELSDRQRQLQQKIKRNISLRSSLYESLSDHTLTKTEYLSLKRQYEEEAVRLQRELEESKKEEQQRIKSLYPQNKWIALLKNYQEGKIGGSKMVLSRMMAVELIKYIRISGYNEMEIVWKFHDEFIRLAREVESYGEIGGEGGRNMKTIALYMRLSNDDAHEGESCSISNQRVLLLDYIKNHEEFDNWNVLEFYDDGYSGVSFERPGIQKLLSLAGTMVNCIIVKDFSRFSRNLVEVGDYLDQIFPFLGVRFIAVNEGYDSGQGMGSSVSLDVSLKALVYEMYSRDVSEKIRSVKHAKMRKGEYQGIIAFYGYKRNKTAKGGLQVDEPAAEVVHRIFRMAAEGISPTNIAVQLNHDSIPSPLMYRRENHTDGGHSWRVAGNLTCWTRENVRRTLCDERYTGRLISYTRAKEDVSSKVSKLLLKEEWIIAEDAHEALVSKEMFERAQMV